jgi:hypothetical protein
LAERGESNISAPSGAVLVEARLAEQGQVAVSSAGDCVVFDDQLLVTRFVEAQLTPAATVSPVGVIVKVANATVSGAGAVANAPGFIIKVANSQISSTGQVVLGDENFVFIVQFAESSVSGSGTVLADSVANIESLDPDQRTFIRPPMTTNFVRPFQQFTFRRPS